MSFFSFFFFVTFLVMTFVEAGRSEREREAFVFKCGDSGGKAEWNTLEKEKRKEERKKEENKLQHHRRIPPGERQTHSLRTCSPPAGDAASHASACCARGTVRHVAGLSSCGAVETT